MTTTHEDWRARRLAAIPNDLLTGSGRRRLARWLEARGYRPTLIELETERQRRRHEGSSR